MDTIVLISPEQGEERIDRALGEPSATVRRWEDDFLHIHPTKVVGACLDADPAVVCIGPGVPLTVAVDIAAAFDQERPECGVLLIAEASAAVWEAALRAGVRDVVDAGASDEALAQALRGVLAVAERRRSTVTSAQARAAAAEASRVITVLSPKGGSGKTTMATNLAIGLAKAGTTVALVDLDLQFGDVASALQLSAEHTMADVARAPRDFDATMLKVFLTAHPSGLYVLCAPETPAEADDITTAQSAGAIDLLRAQFAHVVVDTGAGIDEHVLAAIEASTDIVLVGATDVASVRALRKEIDVLDRLGMVGQRRHLVLNRSDAKVGMDAANIEAVLGMPIDVSVPSSRLVPLSSNEGNAILEGAMRSPVARELTKLVDRFGSADASARVAASSRRFGRGVR